HGVGKIPHATIRLLTGLGVEGDAHAGKTVQHLYRMKLDPTAPNLAQVHFLHAELFDEMAAQGFALEAGTLGENVLTQGIDLINLPTGTIFRIGAEAVVEISGIRNPCKQIDGVAQGLTKALFDRDAAGQVVRKAGIMGIVVSGGVVNPGDAIAVTLPPEPHRRLEVV
ncbi:MOSC domain-containing protein, partial [Beijerinckia sp. L45]|uniref:MOSC domain-containing protein n=1 Tax=Beijerinckia sp. L45 TaxID=1641855 RepID=UPI001AED417A